MTEDNPIVTKIKEIAHWRVSIRPSDYVDERLASLRDCLEIVERAQVRLRGWPFPYIAKSNDKREFSGKYVASWAETMHLEYWRMYLSGQFVYLSAFSEDVDRSYKEKMRQTMRKHLNFRPDVDWNHVPGFVDVLGFIYSITEIFEFATRLCGTGGLGPELHMSISIRNVEGYVLAMGWDRAWDEYYVSSEKKHENNQRYACGDLLGRSGPIALSTAKFFFERFGWLDPSMSVFEKDQGKFLARKL